MTEPRVQGDELLLDGQAVAKLLPCVETGNSLRFALEEAAGAASCPGQANLFQSNVYDRAAIEKEIEKLRKLAGELAGNDAELAEGLHGTAANLVAAIP